MTVRWLRPVLTATTLLAAAACSTADYGKPVNDFAAATAEAETVLAQLNTDVTDAYRAVLENRIMGRRAFLRARDQECNIASERCRLMLVDLADDKKREPFPPEPPLVQMTLVMGQISKYAANLKALLEADTAKQVEGRVNAALGSVQNLAQTVADARAGKATEVPQFATPAGSAVNWVVGQYVEHVKYKGLQDATKAAKMPVRDAAELFAVASGFISDVPRADLTEETRLAADAFRQGATSASLAGYAQSAAKYDAFLTSTPRQLFRDMAAAHDALADSLQNQDVTLVTAIARVEAFAAEAKKLSKILKDLRAVVPAKPGDKP